MKPEQKIIELENRLALLESKFRKLDDETIKIVGDYASTTVPVTINGIRRKITHAAP